MIDFIPAIERRGAPAAAAVLGDVKPIDVVGRECSAVRFAGTAIRLIRVVSVAILRAQASSLVATSVVFGVAGTVAFAGVFNVSTAPASPCGVALLGVLGVPQTRFLASALGVFVAPSPRLLTVFRAPASLATGMEAVKATVEMIGCGGEFLVAPRASLHLDFFGHDGNSLRGNFTRTAVSGGK